MNDRYSNFVVACLYCTFAAFSPLVFANDVRVGVSPTTGYYEVTSKTFDVPKGATVSSSTAVSPTVTPLSGGGFQQSMGGGITIEGLKKPAPFTARAAAGLNTMKNAAKKLVRSNPSSFALSAGGALLFSSLDWIIDQSQIVKSLPAEASSPIGEPSTSTYCYTYRGGGCYASASSACSAFGLPNVRPYDDPSTNIVAYCFYTPSSTSSQGYSSFISFSSSLSCPVGSSLTNKGCISGSPKIETVSSVDIDSSIDSKYVPHVDDFILLTPYMPPDYILVDPILPVVTDLGITNTFDSSGWLTGTEQKTSTTEFTVSNNSTSQPSISASTSVKTETFKDGQPQGSTVTETTQPATGGGSKVEIPTVEIPTDCDFHPTLCKWLDWTKEEPEEPDDNLSNLLKEVPISSKTFTISGGAAACPAPLVLNLSQFGLREVSYQPLCDLASTMKFLYLALMSFAAAVLLHRSINRV